MDLRPARSDDSMFAVSAQLLPLAAIANNRNATSAMVEKTERETLEKALNIARPASLGVA